MLRDYFFTVLNLSIFCLFKGGISEWKCQDFTLSFKPDLRQVLWIDDLTANLFVQKQLIGSKSQYLWFFREYSTLIAKVWSCLYSCILFYLLYSFYLFNENLQRLESLPRRTGFKSLHITWEIRHKRPKYSSYIYFAAFWNGNQLLWLLRKYYSNYSMLLTRRLEVF